MDDDRKVVTQMPLTELWRGGGEFATEFRVRWVTSDDIRGLLQTGHVQFVVADLGRPTLWIPVSECYDFWKTEVRPHFAAPESTASLNDFPDTYCYFASEWSNRDGVPIIVCEKHH